MQEKKEVHVMYDDEIPVVDQTCPLAQRIISEVVKLVAPMLNCLKYLKMQCHHFERNSTLQ